MRYKLLIIAISFIVIAVVIYKSPSGFTDMPNLYDKRCYVDNNLLGTPYTFGSGFNGLVYSYDECNKLNGFYKYDPSYPNGKGRCYIHEKNIVDDDSYNIACVKKPVPIPIKVDTRCYVNNFKLGYDKLTQGNNTLRLYNKKECDMLDGIYDKSTNFCAIKGGNPNTQSINDSFSYLCGSGFF
mgnify:CR=1 FL=1